MGFTTGVDDPSPRLKTRREALAWAAGLPFISAVLGSGRPPTASAQRATGPGRTSIPAGPNEAPTPPGIRQRTLNDINGLSVHVLEAGYETPGRPAVLLLHGFPETAYSWRKLMVPLASAGYHVIAPDQRGYGYTSGWDDRYDGDLPSFRTHSLARDALGVVSAMGYRSVAAVMGHDVGSMMAAYCALVRPDVFRSLVMMSFPFDGPPAIPFGSADLPSAPKPPSLDEQLSALPRPRKDSTAFFSTPEANADMLYAPQGLHDFLRAYYHAKSADWPENHPHPLTSGSASELATLPGYYTMDRNLGMAATVAPYMPTAAQIAANRWLPDGDLAIEGAGHWVQQEQPERVNTVLLDFLQRASS